MSTAPSRFRGARQLARRVTRTGFLAAAGLWFAAAGSLAHAQQTIQELEWREVLDASTADPPLSQVLFRGEVLTVGPPHRFDLESFDFQELQEFDYGTILFDFNWKEGLVFKAFCATVLGKEVVVLAEGRALWRERVEEPIYGGGVAFFSYDEGRAVMLALGGDFFPIERLNGFHRVQPAPLEAASTAPLLVSGTMLQPDGRPASWAKLEFEAEQAFYPSLVTEALPDGHFGVRGRPGRYRMKVLHPSGALLEETFVDIAEGGSLGTYWLPAGGTVRLWMIDRAAVRRQEISRATIERSGTPWDALGADLRPNSVFQRLKDGSLRFGPLPAGSYRIHAFSRDGLRVSALVEILEDQEVTQVLAHRPSGQAAQLALSLTADRDWPYWQYRVALRPADAPAAGRGRLGLPWAGQSILGAGGKAQLRGLYAGPFELFLIPSAPWAEPVPVGTVELSPGANQEEIPAPMPASLSLELALAHDDAPVVGAELQQWTGREWKGLPEPGAAVVTDDRGIAEFAALPPGVLLVSVRLPGVSGRLLIREELTSGRNVAQLEIQKATRVEGRVTGGESPLRVHLIPFSMVEEELCEKIASSALEQVWGLVNSGSVSSASVFPCEADGSFRIPQVLPGRYFLHARSGDRLSELMELVIPEDGVEAVELSIRPACQVVPGWEGKGDLRPGAGLSCQVMSPDGRQCGWIRLKSRSAASRKEGKRDGVDLLPQERLSFRVLDGGRLLQEIEADLRGVLQAFVIWNPETGLRVVTRKAVQGGAGERG